MPRVVTPLSREVLHSCVRRVYLTCESKSTHCRLQCAESWAEECDAMGDKPVGKPGRRSRAGRTGQPTLLLQAAHSSEGSACEDPPSKTARRRKADRVERAPSSCEKAKARRLIERRCGSVVSLADPLRSPRGEGGRFGCSRAGRGRTHVQQEVRARLPELRGAS
ncbi:hypothetical protein AAT19DRAFT_13454 [Rhodotorula toruloides]|uniref:Uncharacterized protein n=1 Tax=Rhodotorula toruloides TaxID=5286 RepID=A0A2T0AEL4_RHOTO|nr:hypothetical protein AAT19DRAFT_13454 [Rhodotorula toruloides]